MDISKLEYYFLRQDLIANIQLADNKINTYMLSGLYCDDAVKKLLEALEPNVEAPEAPESYKIFNALSTEHVKYQCEVYRNILLNKYALIKEALEIQKMYKKIQDKNTKELAQKLYKNSIWR